MSVETSRPATAQQTEPLLSMKNIGRSFPGVRALDGVSIDVLPGEVHGIVGENGAGKSTLMAIASGALAASEGTVEIAGHTLSGADPQLARRLGIAVVRQEPALLPDLTVAENFYLGVSPDKRPKLGTAVRWADDLLDEWAASKQFGASTRVDQLDMQQRFVVEICRSFAQQPKVLVLDEPTEHLQAEEVDILFQLVRDHVARDRAVVYISHRINEVKQIADHISVLRGGAGQGTYPAATLSEDDIVSLIVGRKLDAVFPAKPTPDPSAPVVLRVEGFSSEHVAPLDLAVRGRQIVGLAGIEGNGQREFLRALAGLQPSKGSVQVSGHPVRLGGSRSPIAFVPSDRHGEGVVSGLSVRENAVARHFGTIAPRGWVHDDVEDELARRIVREFRVKTPSTETDINSLSGGNKQKVVIGSVLTAGPPVVLVDEPTQGVDIGARSEIYTALRRAADDGAAVVVLSSDARELAGLVDDVLVFSRGQIIDQLTGDDVTEQNITSRALHTTSVRERTVRRVGRVSGWLAGDSAPALIAGGLTLVTAIVTGILSPTFLSAFSIEALLISTAVLGIAALGQVCVLLTGGIDMSVGPLMGLVVAIGSYYFVDGLPYSWQFVGWVSIVVVSLAVGALNWFLVDVVKLKPMIATLATFMALQGVGLVLRPAPTGSVSSWITDPLNSAVDFLPIAFVVAVLLAVVADVVLKRHSAGVAVRAVGSQSERARVNGLHPPPRVRLSAYLICSLLAGLAGVLLMAQVGVGDATSGNNFTLTAITAAVIGGASAFGGRGLFIGALLGALLVQVLISATTFLGVSTAWQFVATGLMTAGAVAAYSLNRRRAAVSS